MEPIIGEYYIAVNSGYKYIIRLDFSKKKKKENYYTSNLWKSMGNSSVNTMTGGFFILERLAKAEEIYKLTGEKYKSKEIIYEIFN